MSVIDGNTVDGKDLCDFVHNAVTSSFNTVGVKDSTDIVALNVVDIHILIELPDNREVDTLSLQKDEYGQQEHT